VVLQWTIRLIGLVSVLVLARLLTPEDFGIIGIAMATVALIEVLGAIGLRQALLRIESPTRAHYDTAWTIQLVVCSGIGILVLASAPMASWAYGEPRLAPVLAVLAFRFLFFGLVNIGVVDFDRELRFGADMRMRVASRLGAFVLTLGAALLLRNHWALVVGLVSQSALLAIGSYVAHPYRPRLSLAERATLLGFSLWMLLIYAAETVQRQAERLVAAALGGAHLAGLYSVSKDLSEIFTEEISTALNRVTFVTIAGGAGLDTDPARLTRLLGCYALISAPAGFGLAATAPNAVAVLLGPQWVEAAPLLTIIAVYSALFAIYRLISTSLAAAGHARLAAGVAGIGAGLTVIACTLVGGLTRDPLALAASALAANLLLLLLALGMLARRARTARLPLAAAIARPFLAAGLMALAIRFAPIHGGPPVVELAVEVAFGVPLYVLLVLLLWFAFGRPQGAEAEAVGIIRRAAGDLGLAGILR